MRLFAILPVKRFDDAKQRLSQALGADARRALAQAMCSDAMAALQRCGAIEQVVVVSADPDAQRLAAGYGAAVLDDPGAGHSAAAAEAVAYAKRDGATAALMVPGDCPLLDPGELEALIAEELTTERSSVVIVPDRHGTGTNALLLSPPDAMSPAFGPGSRERHAALARDHGMEPVIRELPSLALDIDTPEDLDELGRALRSQEHPAAHTRTALSQLTPTPPA